MYFAQNNGEPIDIPIKPAESSLHLLPTDIDKVIEALTKYECETCFFFRQGDIRYATHIITIYSSLQGEELQKLFDDEIYPLISDYIKASENE